ncbi:hypothetical protein Slin15195_G021960 [Septoria linicola]|uniref:Uncharacterized protein n=1 Tax=Septoria linicola TaxID=215465 RepID=A0A9Q9AGT2_9PEZI|nr:hypothetical protein Slin14017_G130430 [Septoria linicola]USW48877.1 hypothetical protein Slin15195_G021960 [Septoria linicola]
MAMGSKSLWTIQGSGTFACHTCVRQKRICFRWETSVTGFVALPLPPEIQKGAGSAQERHFRLAEFENPIPMPPLWIKMQVLNDEARRNPRGPGRPRKALPAADAEE